MMKSLFKLGKKIVPEGKLRESLKDLYYSLEYHKLSSYDKNCLLDYDKSTEIYQMIFLNGDINGTSILFPKTKLRWIVPVSYELPSYFSLKNISPSSLVIDAGAFPGDFTIAAAKKAPYGKVIALEPNPENRKYLEKVVEINHMSKIVEILPYALSDLEKNKELILNNAASYIKDNEEDNNKEKITVETTTIDNLISSYKNNNSSNFIKMDIEGHELNAIKGANNTLNKGAIFAIASYHIIDGKETSIKLEEIFKKNEYQVKHMNKNHKVTFAYK